MNSNSSGNDIANDSNISFGTRKISRSEGEENFGEFPVMVGGRGPSDARFSRARMRVCARRWL